MGNYNFSNYDGVVISGRSTRPLSVEQRKVILSRYRQLFAEAKVPVLGICFGAEIFAFSYGARIRRMNMGEFGQVEIHFNSSYPLSNGVGSMTVYQSHMMMIEDLPECIKNYASSTTCPNQVLKHRSRPQFGVQFHPEMTEDDTILSNFVDLCADSPSYAGSPELSDMDTHR